MAVTMTKRGQQDNNIAYEFMCDTIADLDKIESRYITMGSVAIVIEGSAGFEVYMANSQKKWINIGSSGSSSSDEDSSASSPTVDKGQADSMVLQE